MRIRTDDEVYRVDAVWLGPPRATMPWRARYVAWGVGAVVFLVVLTVERRIGISLFWSIAWGIVVTILITRLITSKISHERPLGAAAAMWVRELTAPREVTTGSGGAASATRVRVRGERPRPRPKQGRQPKRSTSRQHKHSSKRPARNRRGGGVRTPTQARA
ncbi:hypothetical protein [Actinophytocola gossypii]|uniref:DUF3040 domain-containing protein n=1 Tax=Actinophytocola gossypii TaxID=2812003 RepID=A0ABT2JJD1_9PSEU|nr:hypothetical protein [Actinophytocola gossypii]MCT2587364.1 hypothetical protein [Actinophytocola gossypii]